MCCIIVCPKEKRPSLSVLQQVAAANPHGAGIAWRENGSIQYLKTDDVTEIHRAANRARGEVVIHFRIASVGGVCPELRHPFPVTKRAGLCERAGAPAVLFQNGTWSDWREAVAEAVDDGHKAPAGKMSDSRAAAWLCHTLGRHDWLKDVWSKWVYFSGTELVRYGEWREHDGMLFSNLHWCGRDSSIAPHLQVKAPQGADPKPAKAVVSERRQCVLPFQPSPEFLENAERIRSRNRN